MALKIPYLYDYITKLCTKQAELIQNHQNPYARATGQGEAIHMSSMHKRLKLGGGQAYDSSSD
jgi:hypothetical protein